jgi:hypothetical protein
MTALYELRFEVEEFSALGLVEEEQWDVFIDEFVGEPMAHGWEPIAVKPLYGDRPLSDFPELLGRVMVMSARAIDALGPLLEPHGELLPLQCEDGELWAFNVLTILDVMDTERSVAHWHEPGKRLSALRELVLAEPLPDAPPPIFKLEQWRPGRPLVTGEFLDAARTQRLTGLDPRALPT